MNKPGHSSFRTSPSSLPSSASSSSFPPPEITSRSLSLSLSHRFSSSLSHLLFSDSLTVCCLSYRLSSSFFLTVWIYISFSFWIFVFTVSSHLPISQFSAVFSLPFFGILRTSSNLRRP